jgi:hypothetical protein
MTEAQYVQRLLAAYRALPDSTGHVRAADRVLAQRLFHEGLPLDLVCTAFRVAMSRRRARPPDAAPLPTIRSLHYFLPVIEEARDLDRGYLDYIAGRPLQ